MRKPIDIQGHKFGKWTVLYIDNSCHSKNVRWICKCECGCIKSVMGTTLRTGKSTCCRRCSCHKPKGKLSSRIWSRMKYRSKIQNRDFNWDDNTGKQFLYDLLYNKQNGCCALSGMPIEIAATCKEDMAGMTTASVDRIDSNLGYSKGNVQWIHKDINKMKSNFEQKYFLELCRLITENSKEQPC